MNFSSMHRYAFIAAIFLVILPHAPVASAEAPEWVRVAQVHHAGSACPAGGVQASLSPDLQALTFLHEDLGTEAGPGIPLASRRKNCQLVVDLEFPSGWSYALKSMDFRGFVSLAPRVQAVIQSAYYFPHGAGSVRFRIILTSDSQDDYILHGRDTLGVSALMWSPCHSRRPLNLNTSFQIDTSRNPRGYGRVGDPDQVDGEVALTYGIQWRRCR